MDEVELIDRCILKDPLAWSEFVRRYSKLVYWSITNRLVKWDYLYLREDIEEIHQNVFLGLWESDKLSRLKDRRKITSWIVIISGNETVDYFKYRRSQSPPNAVSIFEKISGKESLITIADLIRARDPNPFEEASLKETLKIVDSEIDSLPPRDKIILELNLLYNKKNREIGEILNMPTGSVSTALKGIRSRLRDRLKEKF